MNLFKNFKLLFLLIINILLLGNQVEGKVSFTENGYNSSIASITQMLLYPHSDWTTLKGVWVENNITYGSNKTEYETNVKVPEDLQNVITIYPNPAVESITIESSKGNAVIYNLQGIKLLETQLNQGFTILDITSLPSGLFVIEMNIDDVVSQHKLVVIK